MGMDFPAGQTVFRDRRALTGTRYAPTAQKRDGDWDPEQSIELPNAFIGPSTGIAPVDATRSQILTTESLFLGDTTADVIPKDRIRVGGTLADLDTGRVIGYVEVRPDAPANPFTGWQPVVEIPLNLAEG